MSDDFETNLPLPQRPHRRPTLRDSSERERLSVGGFFAEHRKIVDERKDHLARLGMDATHVDALRMPAREDGTLPARGKPASPLPISIASTESADGLTPDVTSKPSALWGAKRKEDDA